MKRLNRLFVCLLVACFFCRSIVLAEDSNCQNSDKNESYVQIEECEQTSREAIVASEWNPESIQQEEIEYPSWQEGYINQYIGVDYDANLLTHTQRYLFASDANNISKYSLKDDGDVSPVKNQGSYGTCWAFASIASAESSALKKNLTNQIDLSELQLAYYTYHKENDPLGLTTGDYTQSNKVSTSNLFNAGGDVMMASVILAGGVGFVNEALFPYSWASSIQSGKVPDQSLAYESTSYYLTNARWIAMSERNLVKEVLMNYGAIACSYYESNTYYNSKTAGYYCDSDQLANHGITIVGWDDQFSRNNFNKTPATDGAWLVKNSWGTNSRNNGYFWISYCDVNLSDVGVQLEVDTLEQFKHIYQYDGTGSISYIQVPYNTIKVANNYVAQEPEVLKKVGFFSSESDVSYTIGVYLNGDGSNPTSGSLVSSTSGTCQYGGYRVIDLDQEVYLAKGCPFSIVIQLTAENRKSIGIMTDNSSSNSYYTYHNECEANQSLYQLPNKANWNDLSNTGKTARIKAYTFQTDFRFEKDELSVYLDETACNPVVAPGTYQYSSLDETIAKVDDTGVVTGLKEGTVIIQAVDENQQSCQYLLTVKNPFVIENHILISYEGNLNNIAIPNGVKEIGKEALMDQGLICIFLPDSVEVIQEAAFKGNQISEITLNENIKSVGKEAFQGNPLTRLEISKGEKQFGENAIQISSVTELVIDPSCWLEREQLQPTCTEYGHSSGHYYQYYDEINDFQWLEPLGHAFGNYEDHHDETCTNYGTLTSKCERCGQEDVISNGQLKPHCYQDFQVDGTTFRRCQSCFNLFSLTDEAFVMVKEKTKIEALKDYCAFAEGDAVTISGSANGLLATGTLIQIQHSVDLLDVYRIVVNGDVNGDGFINSVDYIFIKNHIMKTVAIQSEANVIAADYNKDEAISSMDYIGIKNYIMNGGK